MRSIPSFVIVFICLFYILMTILSMFGILSLLKSKSAFFRTAVKLFFLLISISIIVSFFFFYVYPYHPVEATNIKKYIWFNGIFIADFLFKIPIALFWAFSNSLRRKSGPVLTLAGLILSTGMLLVILCGFIFGRNNLQINEVILSYPALPAGFDGYRILQFSDLHLGSFGNNSKLFAKLTEHIKSAKPDLIVFTGDLVNNFSNEVEGKRLDLNGSSNEIPCLAILGNHDYGDYYKWSSPTEKETNFQRIIKEFNQLGFRLLRNENQVINSKGDSIYVIGVENWGYPPFPQYADLEKAQINIPEHSFNILLTHDPAHWDRCNDRGETFPLTLSGHTHGLQWGIKKGGVINFSFMKLIRSHWGGLYKNGANYLYVNRGIGTIGFPFRIDMQAEVTIFTLTKY